MQQIPRRKEVKKTISETPTKSQAQEQGPGNPSPQPDPPAQPSFEENLQQSVSSMTNALGNVRTARTGVESSEEQVRSAERILAAAEESRQVSVESAAQARSDLDQSIGNLIGLLQTFLSSL